MTGRPLACTTFRHRLLRLCVRARYNHLGSGGDASSPFRALRNIVHRISVGTRASGPLAGLCHSCPPAICVRAVLRVASCRARVSICVAMLPRHCRDGANAPSAKLRICQFYANFSRNCLTRSGALISILAEAVEGNLDELEAHFEEYPNRVYTKFANTRAATCYLPQKASRWRRLEARSVRKCQAANLVLCVCARTVFCEAKVVNNICAILDHSGVANNCMRN